MMKSKFIFLFEFLLVLGLSGCCCRPVPTGAYTSPDYTTVSEPIVDTDPLLQQYSRNTVNPGPGLYEAKEMASIKYSHPKIMPATSHQSDKEWVSAQPSSGYTIKVAQNDKPSKVAKVLYQAPKTAHVAEIATADGYVGVFGTYHSEEEAAQAMQSLPDEIRKEAKVTPWHQIRSLE